jgi:hypothetical protein
MNEIRKAEQAILDDIAVMMSEFVDNWPEPKKIDTAMALIAKTLRAALDPPRHDFWRAGEADCPADIKAGNGELHTLRCKVCGRDNPRDDRCILRPLAALESRPASTEERARERANDYAPLGSPIPEARVSLLARAIRHSLRSYGHKCAESSLPECIASDVESALATETQPVAGGEQDEHDREIVWAKQEAHREGYRAAMKTIHDAAPADVTKRLLSLKRMSASIYGPLIDQAISLIAKPTTPARAKALETDETCVLRKRKPGFFGDGHSKAKGADVERPDEPSAPD